MALMVFAQRPIEFSACSTTRRVVPQLDVPHGPNVDPGPLCQLSLRKPEPEPGRPNLPGRAVQFGHEAAPEDGFDRRPTSREREGLVSLPGGDGHLPDV